MERMKLTIENKTLHKFEKEGSKLRMCGGAWSINMDLIFGKDIDNVVYETSKFIYSIPLNKAKERGFYRFLGNERKLVVPIEKNWQIDKK